MGCSGGVPGLFRAVPGCSGGVLGMFRSVPECSGVFRGVPGFTDTPSRGYRTCAWQLKNSKNRVRQHVDAGVG